MSCTECNDCENFCTSEITCVDANFTNILVAADATLNDVLEFIDEGLVGLVGPQGDQGIQGVPGTPGTPGTNGSNGARGNVGSNCMIWDNTNSGDSAGGFDSDSSNFQDITQLNFNKTSKVGYAGVNGSFKNADNWLSSIAIGDIIQVHQVDDSSKFGIYTVGSITKTFTTCYISVSVITANSTFDPNKQYTVSFAKKGAKGLDVAIPTGTIQMYAAMDAPEGWLVCNGDIVSTATYPDLFSVIGSNFNVGTVTGSNFQLPNFSGRVPVGIGAATDTTFGVSLADSFGSAVHYINTDQIPQHTHTITDPGHTHDLTVDNGSVGAPIASGLGSVVTSNVTAVTTRTDLVHNGGTGITATNPNTSAEQPIPIMQPYLGINFIIKY